MPLLVCGTPIGNLDDVTLRVVRTLCDADALLCEDTRHTRILLGRHGIRARELLSLHRHNEEARTEEILARLREGATVALVSDAGMPGIADPGGRLVAHAVAAGIEISVLPGASAVTAALAVSGLLGDGPFRFVGWLPRKEAGREALWQRLAGESDPAVAFESPRRVRASLASLAGFDPARRVCLCRELTKMHESVLRGTAGEVLGALDDEPRGEITLVIAPAGRLARRGRSAGRRRGDGRAARVGNTPTAGRGRRRPAHRHLPERSLPRRSVDSIDNSRPGPLSSPALTSVLTTRSWSRCSGGWQHVWRGAHPGVQGGEQDGERGGGARRSGWPSSAWRSPSEPRPGVGPPGALCSARSPSDRIRMPEGSTVGSTSPRPWTRT